MTNKKPLVIYHHPCLDGFTSAYIAWREFGDKAEYYPGIHDQKDTLPDVTDRLVYILDFSYKAPVMRKLAEQAGKIIVLDHHQSAQEDLLPLLEEGVIVGEFDMDRSGAGITWDWFNLDEPRLPFVDYVEDRDLWRFALPDSKEINQAMFSYAYSFENWAMIEEKGIEHLRSEGNAIWRKHMKDVDELCAQVTELTIGNVTVPAVNANYFYGSDLAGKLADGQPFAAYFWMNKQKKIVFGLRSREGQDQSLDVAKIAQSYGGGGHKHASGFTINKLEDL